ncbi:MAG: hypothetical protein JWM78_2875 [Verrucomicrobiaceae bacterium]|nr:hypothetical protein [Verrucomicrobiaceae bacterium]
MKKISAVTIFFAASLALMAGCERNTETGKVVTIEPGQFVATEPSALHGSVSKSEKCSIDTVNGKLREPKVGWEIKRGQPLNLEGWIFSENGKQVSPQVFVELSGPVETYYAVTNTRILRGDANQHFSIDPSLQGGFQLQAKTDAIEPGNYQITILQSFSDRRENCEDGVSLIVN